MTVALTLLTRGLVSSSGELGSGGGRCLIASRSPDVLLNEGAQACLLAEVSAVFRHPHHVANDERVQMLAATLAYMMQRAGRSHLARAAYRQLRRLSCTRRRSGTASINFRTSCRTPSVGAAVGRRLATATVGARRMLRQRVVLSIGHVVRFDAVNGAESGEWSM
eukprot:scaffold15168_cov126-Isochrysis_galbana.AAC.4